MEKETHKLSQIYLGGGFCHFLFHPDPWVNARNLTCAYFFQMGWLNHQVVRTWLLLLRLKLCHRRCPPCVLHPLDSLTILFVCT